MNAEVAQCERSNIKCYTSAFSNIYLMSLRSSLGLTPPMLSLQLNTSPAAGGTPTRISTNINNNVDNDK